MGEGRVGCQTKEGRQAGDKTAPVDKTLSKRKSMRNRGKKVRDNFCWQTITRAAFPSAPLIETRKLDPLCAEQSVNRQNPNFVAKSNCVCDGFRGLV